MEVTKVTSSNPRTIQSVLHPVKVFNPSKLVQPTLLQVTTIHHYLPGFTTIYYGLPRCESTQKTVMLSIIWKFTDHMIKVMDQSDWPLFQISWIPALYLVQNQILFCIINRTSTKLYFEQNINIQESDRWYRDLIVTMVPVQPSLPEVTLQYLKKSACSVRFIRYEIIPVDTP